MEANFLSKNIRYLRKRRRLSQQKLAEALNVKRSNIAAYETKDVEPRLGLVYRLAEFFDVSLTDLIINDLEQQLSHKLVDTPPKTELGGNADGAFYYERGQQEPPLLSDVVSLNRFREQSINIRKMLEGFKIFYEYKKHIIPRDEEDRRRIYSDIDNFLIFIDHMLRYNEAIIDMLENPGR